MVSLCSAFPNLRQGFSLTTISRQVVQLKTSFQASEFSHRAHLCTMMNCLADKDCIVTKIVIASVSLFTNILSSTSTVK